MWPVLFSAEATIPCLFLTWVHTPQGRPNYEEAVQDRSLGVTDEILSRMGQQPDHAFLLAASPSVRAGEEKYLE